MLGRVFVCQARGRLLARSDAISDGLSCVAYAGALRKMKCELGNAGVEIGLVQRFECFADLLVQPTTIELGNLVVDNVA